MDSTTHLRGSDELLPERETMHKLTALLAFLPLLAGCASGSQTRAGLAQSAPNVTMTTPELRIRSSLYAGNFAAIVESAADSIIVMTDDVPTRRKALIWKATAIPEFQKSVLISDPLAALIDGWTFSIQMEQYFTVGAGSDEFGRWQPIVRRASAELVRRAEEIARLATTDSGYVAGETFVTAWAAEHPFESLVFGREHTAVAWADRLGTGARGGLAAAADINEAIQVMSNRMSMYAATLPKQATWQAQLLMSYYFYDPQMQAFLGEISSIDSAVASIESQFGDIRDVFVDIDHILVATVDSAFAELDEQIAAMMDEMLQEDGALSAMIAEQRQAIFDDVTRQRVAAMAELDSVVQHAVQTALADSNQVIDHMFLRAVQLLAGLLVVAVIGLAVFTRMKRRA